MTYTELFILLSIYAIIPLFCAYQIVQIGRNMNKRLDKIYSRYHRTEEKILDVIEFRAGSRKKDEENT